MKNYEAFQNRDLRPTWLDKSWQVLWNWNDHNKNHGISPHSDESATYSNVDPITSFSFGHGGVLTLGPKKGPVTRMLFQEGGDALVAANSDVAIPEAEWRTFSKPSAAMARKVAAFEKSAGGFKLAPEQLSACRWLVRQWM